jgi:hypothetical protein
VLWAAAWRNRPEPVAGQGGRVQGSQKTACRWFRDVLASGSVPRRAWAGSKGAGRGGRVKRGPGWEASRRVWPVETGLVMEGMTYLT